MGPLPWVFLFLSVSCLVIGVLVLIYFMNMTYLMNKIRGMDSSHLWVW